MSDIETAIFRIIIRKSVEIYWTGVSFVPLAVFCLFLFRSFVSVFGVWSLFVVKEHIVIHCRFQKAYLLKNWQTLSDLLGYIDEKALLILLAGKIKLKHSKGEIEMELLQLMKDSFDGIVEGESHPFRKKQGER